MKGKDGKVEKGKVIYVNDVPSEFVGLNNYIKTSIENCFNYFDFVCKLKIKFVENRKLNEFEVTDCFLKNISINNHTIYITNSCLKTIYYDGGDFFYTAIFHEMSHIKDYVEMMKTGLFDFNLCLEIHNSFPNTYISTGFGFWTEIYAYIMTIRFAKENNIIYEKITFNNLVKKYIKVKNFDKQIENKLDLTVEEAEQYVKYVKSFDYLCAKFMASVYENHSRMPWCKIQNDKNYKKVYSILKKLEPKVIKLFKNGYSKNVNVDLYNLGKCIWEQINWKIFHIGLTEKAGKIYPFY